MDYRRLAAGAFCLLAACTELPHEAPYDPLSDADLQATAQLSGSVVLDGESDSSQVSVELINNSRTYTVDTKADGAFRLTGIVPGQYHISFGTRYFSGITDSISIGIGDKVSLGAKLLKPRTAPVNGSALASVLKNEELLQHGGVTVTLRKIASIRGAAATAPAFRKAAASVTGATRSAVSANNGSFTIADVPAGIYEVEASTADIAAQGMGKISVTGEGPASIQEFVLQPLTGFFTITGRINGQPSTSGYTTDDNVTLTLAGFNATAMKVARSTNGTVSGCTFGDAEALNASRAFLLPFEGTHLLCVRFVDKDGGETDTLVGQIVYDKTAPRLPSLRINNGAAATTQQLVSIALSAVDDLAGVSFYKVGSSAALTAESALPIVPNAAFSLPTAVDGPHWVWASFGDRAGNFSAPISASIILDGTDPLVGAPQVRLPNGTVLSTNALINGTVVMLTSSVADASPLEMRVSTSGSLAGVAWEPYTVSRLINLPPSGPVTLLAEVRDAVNHTVSLLAVFVVNVDTTPPTGTLTRTSAALTNNRVVNLTGASSESPSDMQVSADAGFAGAVWVPAGTTAITLAAGDGTRAIYARFRDSAGNVSGISTASVTLDETAPESPSVAFQQGALWASRNVDLTLSASGAYQMSVTDGTVCNENWEAYATSRNWTLAPLDGTKNVAVNFRDIAGNMVCATRGIGIDTTPPVVNAVALETASGAAVGALLGEPNLVLSSDIADANALEMQVSLTGTYTGIAWEPYAMARAIALPPPASASGTLMRVTARVRDAAGNMSSVIDQQFTLDTVGPGSPAVAVQNKGAGGAVSTATVTVALSATGNPATVELSFDIGFLAPLPAFAMRATTTVTLPPSDGLKTLYVRYIDETGNVSALGADTVILDTLGPELNSLEILGSDPTNAITVTARYASPGASEFRMTEGAVCSGVRLSYGDGDEVVALSAGEGVKTIAVQFFDAIGNESDCITDTVYFDSNPPVALANPFRINAGQPITSSSVVTLSFNASGATKIRYSEDSSFVDAAWQAYSPAKTTVLSAGNGTKRMYAEAADEAGNVLPLAFQSIDLDTSVPTNPYLTAAVDVTTSTTVRLFLGAGSVTQMKVSENAAFTGAVWWSLAAVTDVVISNVDGSKTIYAKFRNALGVETPVVSDTVILDRAAPLLPQVRINGGASVVNTNVVTLNLSAVDVTSGVAAYQVAPSNSFSAILPRTFQANDLYSLLPAGDGIKEVWVRFADRAGNYSAAVSAMVTLDTAAPVMVSATLELPDGTALAPGQLISTSRTFLVSAVNDDTPLEMQLTFNGSFAGAAWEPYNPNRSIDLALPSGAGAEARTIKARVRDSAGHIVDLIDISVDLDTRAPTGSVTRSSPSPATTYTVALSLSASESPSQVQVSADASFRGASWFATVNTTVVLPAGDGLRTIYARYRDNAGNVSGTYAASVEIDSTPPQLASFSILEGALTNQTTVTLLLTVLGATEVQVAEGTCGGSWFGLTTSRSYTFASSVNVPKTIAVRYRDAVGNPSACLTQSTELDTQAPYPEAQPIVINTGADFTTNRSVELALAATQATEMQISENMAFLGAAWMPFADATSWTLSAGETEKTLYVRFRDLAGNATVSSSDSIIVDSVIPAFNALSGPSAASDPTVTLVLAASGANWMRLSENADFSGATWRGFVSPAAFTFSTGQGVHTVYAQLADDAGNESLVRAHTVSLDTNAPSSPIVAIVEGGYAKSAVINVQIFAGDAVAMQRSQNADFSGALWETFSSVKAFTLTGGDGPKTIYVRVKDAADNMSPPASVALVLDTAPPSVTLFQAEDAGGSQITATNQLRFYLRLGVTDANPVTVQFATSNVFAGIPAEAAAALRPWDVLPPTDPAGESRSVYVRVSDAAGHFVDAGPLTVLVDTIGPTGPTVSLAAATVSSPTVTVNLGASNVDWAELSDNIGFLSPLRFAFQAATSYTLPPGDGVKTVYARYADNRGNYSTVVAANVLLDTQAPAAGSVRINDGAVFVTNAGGNVMLTLAASDALSSVSSVRLANAASGGCIPALAGAVADSYAVTKPWVLASPGAGVEGPRWVCTAFRDGAGNWSAPVSASVNYDTKVPSVGGGGIQLAGGSLYSTSTQVALALTASGANEMQLVNGTSFGGAIWEPYRTSLNWLLLASGVEIERTVSVKFRDAAGNETGVYSDAVTLDTVAPSAPSIAINGGAPFAINAFVTLNLSAFGATRMQISNDGNFDAAAILASAPSAGWVLPGIDGMKTVYVRFLDAAGNASPVASASVILDRVAPQGANFTIDEAPRTPLLTIHLTLTATGASEMQISEGTCNGTWVASATSAAHNFQSPIDGNKVIAVRFRDVAGNMTACINKSIILDSTAPLITTMAPRAGATGTLVNISGLNFGVTPGSSTISFGATPATSPAWQNTLLQPTVPLFASPGTVSVAVTVGAATSNALGFIVLPGITDIAPVAGSAGDTVVVTGTSFSSTPGSVTVQGIASQIGSWNQGSITFTIPADVGPGVSNTVVTALGYPSQSIPLVVVPSINGVDGTFLSSGDPLTISGESFGVAQGNTRVTIGGMPASIVAWSSSSIQVLFPAAARGGNVELQIVAPGVSSNILTLTHYAPVIYGRSPALVNEGSSLSITGMDFGPLQTTASVNGIPAGITFWNNTNVQVNVPAGVSKGPAVVEIHNYLYDRSNIVHVTKRGNDVWFAADGLSPRAEAGAVWTGSHMIIWGGNYPNGDGAKYSPAADSWLSLPNAGAPSARFAHTSVWTGSEMIVWGGCSQSPAPGDCDNVKLGGARYNPASDTWQSIASPRSFGRAFHSAVWTGAEMIVFGGACGPSDAALCFDSGPQDIYTNTVDAYAPETGTWTFLSNNGAPSARGRHTAVWTGSEMLVWGGTRPNQPFDDGARYLRGTDTWRSITATGAPNARYGHRAIWTGDRMLMFGGHNMDDSASNAANSYDPKTDAWFWVPVHPALNPRYDHSVIWTGSEMVIWGGSDGGVAYNDGFSYSPQSSQWYPLAMTGAPGVRFGHAAVWTGTDLLVWGGMQNTFSSDAWSNGGRWTRATDTWTTFESLPGQPLPLVNTAIAWTGSEMMVWGGGNFGSEVATGSRYSPATDTWLPVQETGAPTERGNHTMVWTGSEVIVWGGDKGGLRNIVGGRYFPATNSWLTMAAGPNGRYYHTAVWDPVSSGMFVWGGFKGSIADDGGIYYPSLDSWTMILTPGPLARYKHSAAMTPTGEMFIFGGYNGGALGTGYVFYPGSATWMSVPGTTPRYEHSAVALADSLITWGGYNNVGQVIAGGERYSFAQNNWQPISNVDAPENGVNHTGVYNGSAMIVWGGLSRLTFDFTNKGGRYDPVADVWSPITLDGVPEPRAYHKAVWAGDRMLVWGGSSANAGLGSYFVNPNVPAIATVSQAFANTTTQVTITGTWFGNLQGTSEVRVGGVTANIVSWSDTSITFTVAPDSAAGPQDVSVVVNGDESNVRTLTVVPTFGSLSQTNVYGGDVVSISGSGFGTVPGSVMVMPFNTADIVSWSSTQIQFIVPSDVWFGQQDVVVTVASFSSNPQSMVIRPMITGVTPSQAAPWEVVNISGNNFGYWPGTGGGFHIAGQTTGFSNWSMNTSSFWMPNVTAGTHTLRMHVTYDETTDTIASTNIPQYIGNGALNTSTLLVSGLSGEITEADVSLEFSSMNADMRLRLIAPDGTSVILLSPGMYAPGSIVTWLDATTPTEQGLWALKGKNPNGTWTLEILDTEFSSGDANLFKWGLILQHGQSFDATTSVTVKPAITQLDPPIRQAGRSLTILGYGFGLSPTGNQVFVGSTPAFIESWDSSNISITIPSVTPGEHAVTVKVNGIASDAETLEVTAGSPSLIALSPDAGSSGLTIAISGQNFGSQQSTSKVYFGDVTATVLSWSHNLLQVLVPGAAAPGMVPVQVVVGYVPSNTLPFNHESAEIFMRYSASGDINSQITLEGIRFGPSPGTATVGGVLAGIDTWNDTQVKITVSAGTPKGYQRVYVTSASGDRSNAVGYIIRGSDVWIPLLGDNPAGRNEAITVWTGTEMIVWGGRDGREIRSGARYNPLTDSWLPVSPVSAPFNSGTAVWTGMQMIVWDGAGGRRYSPSTDTWENANPTGAPQNRNKHSAVWTGSRMLVWGGRNNNLYLNDGGEYSPSFNEWMALPATGAPAPRGDHAAVWTGDEMIVWGGTHEYSGGITVFNDGARYSPATSAWSPVAALNAPEPRIWPTAVWSGSEMIVWGGILPDFSAALNTGARYNPDVNSWSPVAMTDAPGVRVLHSAVWTNSGMFVFGGCIGAGGNGCGGFTQSGGLYDAASDTWTATPENLQAPSARMQSMAVSIGAEALVWGGTNLDGSLGTGSRYNVSTSAWVPMSGPGLVPTARSGHSAAWTGTEMIVWGGCSRVDYVDGCLAYTSSGAKYRPASDDWIATNTANAPAGVTAQASVFTGTHLVTWGGWGASGLSGAGGRYDPSSDAWTAIGEIAAPRMHHSAVWTGSEVVFWGGYQTGGATATGVRYNPANGVTAATSAAPVTGRGQHAAGWLGSAMLVWGGYDGAAALGDGSLYYPTGDTWAALVENTPPPPARHASAYTVLGDILVFWGGRDGTALLSDGGAYELSTGTWFDLAGAPIGGRTGHTLTFTGSKLVIWGGRNNNDERNDGAAFDLATFSWQYTNDASGISARSGHSAIWDGYGIIIWGGGSRDAVVSSGANYLP